MTSVDERIRKTTFLEAALRRPELGSIFGLFAVIVAFMLMTGPINAGLGEKNTFADMWIRSVGVQSWVELAAYVGILAIAAALLMISGEFDLSIGANVALGGHTFAMLMLSPDPMPLWACIFATFAFMLFVGFITGMLVVSTGLPSFIVTLGFWFANRGFANYLAFRNHDTSRLDIKPMLEERNVLQDGAVVQVPDPTKIDDIFAFKNGFFGWTGEINLPFLQPFELFFNAEFYYFIIIALLAVFILNFTRIGNWIFAAGGDPVAARAVGVPVARVKVGLFMWSAFSAGFLGVVFTLQSGVSEPLAGDFRELHAIAAAVIGGCALTGGYGSVVGAVFGAFIFAIVSRGINFVPFIDNNLFRVILGLMLLGAAMLNQLLRNRVVKG